MFDVQSSAITEKLIKWGASQSFWVRAHIRVQGCEHAEFDARSLSCLLIRLNSFAMS